MLLQLENTNPENISKLIDFANGLNLHLSMLDDSADNYSLPGKPLTAAQLENIIESSRKSGIISMQNAHQLIRRKGNAD